MLDKAVAMSGAAPRGSWLVSVRAWLRASTLVLPLFLSGCPLALVAGGAGGYAVGTDERTVGQQADDAVLTSRVKTRLIADSDVRGMHIDVDTLEGHVTLSGKVRSRVEAARAEALAREVEGVLSVRSLLTVSEP